MCGEGLCVVAVEMVGALSQVAADHGTELGVGQVGGVVKMICRQKM